MSIGLVLSLAALASCAGSESSARLARPQMAGPSNRLSLLQSQLLDLRRQLELELAVALPAQQALLGSPCLESSDCSQAVANSHCLAQNLTCACLPQHVVLNSTTCLPRKHATRTRPAPAPAPARAAPH